MVKFERQSATEVLCCIKMINDLNFNIKIVDKVATPLPNVIVFQNLKKTTKFYEIAQYIQNNMSLY